LSEKKLFDVFANKVQFNVEDYLVPSSESELSDFQKKIIEKATSILKGNTIGDIKLFAGSVKKNEEKFKEFEENAEDELNLDDYKDIKKNLKEYIKKLRELIDKICMAIIPVKEMPWAEVIFRTIPRVEYDDKITLLDNLIAYYGEIKCVLGRSVIYGKIKEEKPLFAPIMGSLDLGGFKIDESNKDPKTHHYSYLTAIIDSLDSPLTKNQLAKYHEGYQRHGDPICDFLMKDDSLLESMKKLISGIESGRISSDVALSGIAVPHPSDKITIILVTDEGDDNNKFTRCFESFLKFSAECCNAPSITTSTGVAPTPLQTSTQQPGVLRTPGGTELKTWTAEELAEEAQKRMSTQPDMPTWSEEELKKLAEERQTSLPEGMEYWTEQELQELARKRQGGLDIPEWKPDENMNECTKCGYALRPGWSKCPICNTPVDTKIPSKSEKSSEKEVSEDKEEEQIEEEDSEKKEDLKQ
jgi:hypothetical protein